MTVNIYYLSNQPVKGSAFSFIMGLYSQADTKLLQDNPTLAAGDVNVIKDGVYDNNIDALPVAITSITRALLVTVSATENNGNYGGLVFHDAAGSEWCDAIVYWSTVQAAAVGTSDYAGGAVASVTAPVTVGTINNDIISANSIAAAAVTKIQSGLATSTNQTTILARLGAWTGTGVNTILGAFKALLSKAATVPSDIGDTFTPTTDSTEAIRDKLDAGVNIIYTAQQLEDAVAGEELTAYRDCTYTVTLEDMGSLADRTKMFFTIKKSLNDADAEAIVQIEETDGLLYLNKAAIESPIEDTDGSITVTDEVAGDATFQIEAVAMAELGISSEMFYDVAITKADGIKVRKTGGIFNILGTATRTWSDA